MTGQPMRPDPKPVKWEKAPRKPLKRSRMKRRPTVDETQDPGKLAFVRTQECVGFLLHGHHVCFGGNTASHLRDHTGTGRRESSDWACCMCANLHLEQWEKRRGPFTGWTQERRVKWMRERCIEVHARWMALPEDVRELWRAATSQRQREP